MVDVQRPCGRLTRLEHYAPVPDIAIRRGRQVTPPGVDVDCRALHVHVTALTDSVLPDDNRVYGGALVGQDVDNLHWVTNVRTGVGAVGEAYDRLLFLLGIAGERHRLGVVGVDCDEHEYRNKGTQNEAALAEPTSSRHVSPLTKGK